jgi:hypothetical protein
MINFGELSDEELANAVVRLAEEEEAAELANNAASAEAVRSRRRWIDAGFVARKARYLLDLRKGTTTSE